MDVSEDALMLNYRSPANTVSDVVTEPPSVLHLHIHLSHKEEDVQLKDIL